MPLMATAIPGRPSPMRDAGWWPECRDGPTGSTFPRMTLSSTWPAGQVTHTIVPAGKRTGRTGRVHRLQAFQFDGAECRTCPLRSQCIAAKGSRGRRVLIHPQEALLQQARALQQSTHYDEYRVRRVVVEHRLARLVQLGIRQSPLFRQGQDAIPAVSGCHGSQPDPGGRENSGGRAVPVAAQQAAASSSILSPLLSPMLRPISARSGSDNCGPCSCSRRLYCPNPPTQPGLSGPVSRGGRQPTSRYYHSGFRPAGDRRPPNAEKITRFLGDSGNRAHR